jgi:hypothetical protein
VSADGLTAAAAAKDLTAEVPSGPRVRAVISKPGEQADLLAAANDQGPAAVPVGEPARTTVDGRKAVGITLKETEGATVLRRRYLAAANAKGTGVLFVLEAPDASFDTHAKVLDAVPGWA